MIRGFTTRAIHGSPERQGVANPLRFPIYENVSFDFDSSEEIEKAFRGESPSHTYTRVSNPTVGELERRITLLCGSLGTVAVSSGMAAIATTIMAIARQGENIITSPYLFGNTHSLFEQTLRPWGLQTRYADLHDEAAVEALIDGSTRAIFVESIANPQMEVCDLAALARIANAHDLLLILDNTVTTPYLCRSIDAGVHLEVVSATKYLSGGGTCVGGLIIDNGNYDWTAHPAYAGDYAKHGPWTFLARLRRGIYRNLGPCLSPHNAYLLSLGLETLALRVDRSCASALAIARALEGDRRVDGTGYPGLPGHPRHDVAARQFAGGFGGILTFALRDRDACFRFMDRLRLIRRATNINDNKTLVLHPGSTIFCEYTCAEKEALGVRENMLRLSVGIEDVEDLWYDIDQALGSRES